MTTIWENFRDKVDTLVAEYIKELGEKNKMLKWELERIKKELEWAKKSWEEFAYKRANSKAENKKLKEELERYKKQYEHTMGED